MRAPNAATTPRPSAAGVGRISALVLAGVVGTVTTPAGAEDYSVSYAALVARLVPTVVSITTRTAVPVNESADDKGSPQVKDSGLTFVGSGFIIDPSGYILTNRHVVKDSFSITVALSDGTRLVAHVVGHPPATDIALLKVDTQHPLPTVQFGDSDKVRVGDKVLAIGNPLGLGETVTSGIVSALNRNTGGSPYDNFLQTDAAINHGNSGGALFDLLGQVIGVNTALVTGSSHESGSIGLGLAIPSNDAQFAARELREYGRVRPGWIGARLQEITPGLAQAFRFQNTGGAVVSVVDKAGPAADVGLKPGDVILQFDGQTPSDVRGLMRMIAKSPLGHVATLTIRHGEKIRNVPVVIKEYPPAEMQARFSFQTYNPPPTIAGDVGLRLAPLDGATRARFSLPADVAGVEVASVPAQSEADRAGLRQGDVILDVQDEPATTPDNVEQDFQRARREGRKELGLLVLGPSGQSWMSLPLTPTQSSR